MKFRITEVRPRGMMSKSRSASDWRNGSAQYSAAPVLLLPPSPEEDPLPNQCMLRRNPRPSESLAFWAARLPSLREESAVQVSHDDHRIGFPRRLM